MSAKAVCLFALSDNSATLGALLTRYEVKVSPALRHLIALQWRLYQRRWTPLSAVNAAIVLIGGYFFLGMGLARWAGDEPSRYTVEQNLLLFAALLGPLPFGALRAVRLLYHPTETTYLLTLPLSAADWFRARFAALFAFNAIWMLLWLLGAWQLQLAQKDDALFVRCVVLLPPVWLLATALQMIVAIAGFALWLRREQARVKMSIVALSALAALMLLPGANATKHIARVMPDIMQSGAAGWCLTSVAAAALVGAALWLARMRHEVDFSLAQTHSRKKHGALWAACCRLFGFLPRSLAMQCARDSVLLLRGAFPRALWMCGALTAVHAIFLMDAAAADWSPSDFRARLRVLFYVVFQFAGLGYVLGFDFFKHKARYLGYTRSLPLTARDWWTGHLVFTWAVGICYMIPYWALFVVKAGAADGSAAVLSLQVLLLGTLLLLHACAFATANFDGIGIPAESQYGPSIAAIGIAATLLLLSPLWWLAPAGYVLHAQLRRKGIYRLQRIEVSA